MQELAEKRTRPTDHEANEPTPKNQIPNQQFFAKLHQQDLEQTRAHRRSMGALKPQFDATGGGQLINASGITEGQIKVEGGEQAVNQSNTSNLATSSPMNNAANISNLDSSYGSTGADESLTSVGQKEALPDVPPLSKKSKFSPSKRTPGARKSNRQRTTRKYLTAAQATGSRSTQQSSTTVAVPTGDSSFTAVADFEETRHSFNATPDINKDSTKKRKSNLPTNTTPLSSLESPITADSGSSSLQPMSTTETETTANQNNQYIKENGEIIKIVRMRQEEIINCLCGYVEEDGLMIQCELCLCWQHGICNGIDKESQVPDKYVCYICRNPVRGRKSMEFKHDQDWLYEGKLPTANYHTQNMALLNKRGDYLKRTHVLTGNLLELKNFMHSLKVKINIANNKCHPKLYLWAKKWDDDVEIKSEIKSESDEIESKLSLTPTSKKIKTEPLTPIRPLPNIPQPEAAIDPVECQQRLQEHIKIQQDLVMQRLSDIESAIDGKLPKFLKQ